MPRKNKYSRLSKTQKKKYTRQTLTLSILTLTLIVVIVFWGIPALVKVAIFLSDINNTTQPISGEDNIPPSPPILQPIIDATNSAQIKIEGFAEEGSTVLLSLNGVIKYETVAETDGEFLFKQIELSDGENEIYTKSIDTSGNESEKSTIQKIILDSQAPEVEVTFPADDQKFYGSSEQQLNILGIAEEGSLITINGSYVILKPDNTFSFKTSLNQGDNNITVVARDNAGNETAVNLIVFFEE